MIITKSKDDTFIKTRALKEHSDKWKIILPANGPLKKVVIKLEIDTNQPLEAITENKNLDFPLLHRINCGNLETLFAGKINAIITRPYNKGQQLDITLDFIKNELTKKNNFN